MADLVPEVAEHGAVRLAEANPQRLAVVVERLDEVDGDHAARVSDGHPVAGGVARQQIEGQPAVAAPERFDGQADVVELVDQPAQRGRRRHQLLAGERVVGGGLAADQRVGQAAAALVGRLPVRGKPIAPERRVLGAGHPSLAVDDRRAVDHRQHGLGRQVKSQRGLAIRALLGLERDEGVAHRTGECAHGQYGGTHATAGDQTCASAAQRTRAGFGPRVVRRRHRAGQASSRRAGPVSHHAAGQQPAAARDPDRATGCRRARPDHRRRRSGGRVRPRPRALHADRGGLAGRSAAAHRRASARRRRRGRVHREGQGRRRRHRHRCRPRGHRRAVQPRRRHQRAAARHHEDEATAVRPGRLRGHHPAAEVADRQARRRGVNSVEHVWDLLPRNQQW